MNDTQTVDYTVAARFIPRIQILLDKVNKRCRRLRLPELVFKITGSEVRTEVKKVNGEQVEFSTTFNHVSLTGPERPKLAGWEFAGTLEHDLDTKLTILRTSKAFGRELPTRFRKSEPVCDHCQLRRTRKDTYVVYSAEADAYKQVGHNCIRDFLGLQNVNQAIESLSLWNDIESILDGDYDSAEDSWREWSNAPKTERVVDLFVFLNRVASCTRVHGFVSRKAVEAWDEKIDTLSDEEQAKAIRPETTRDRVMDHLFPPRKMSERLRQDILDCEETEADKAKAQDAVAWVKAEYDRAEAKGEGLNDYKYNLYAATSNEVMPLRRAGIVASLIGSYNRHLDFEDERQRKQAAAAKALEGKIATCKHVGAVGERLRALTLKVVRVIPREGQYGVTYITALEDLDGNQFTWFASGTSLDAGQTYSVTGTVKSHGDFRGVPQTVLTRCKAEPKPTVAQETPETGKDDRTEAAELPVSPAPERESFISRPDAGRRQDTLPDPVAMRKAHRASQEARRIVLTPEPESPEQQYIRTALQAASLVLQSGNLAGGYLEYDPFLWGKIYAK